MAADSAKGDLKMQPIEILRHARLAALLVKSCQESLDEACLVMYSMPTTSCAAVIGRSQPTAESRQEQFVIRIEEYEQRLQDATARYIDEAQQASDMIDTLDDYTERLILRLRYVNGKKIREVCEIVGYTRSRVYEIHDKGVKNLKKN